MNETIQEHLRLLAFIGKKGVEIVEKSELQPQVQKRLQFQLHAAALAMRAALKQIERAVESTVAASE